MNPAFWQKIQKIDARILYVALIGLIMLALAFPKFVLPIIPSRQTIQAFDTIDRVGKAQPGKIAIVDGWWSASTQGEQKWQTKAILTQLMRDHIRFAILSGDPQNGQLTEELISQLAPTYHYVYGVNYIDWGYKAAYTPLLKGIVQDIPGTLKEDYKGRPLSQFPIMRGVKNISDISLIIEITPVSSLDYWLQLVQGVDHTPLVYVPTAVQAPESYPYLDSHQIAGIVTGIKGAGDYEKLLGVRDFGTQASTALSLVYALIILLIILGNIGFHAERRARRRSGLR